MIDERFIIDDWGVRNILGVIEPIPVKSSNHAIQVKEFLNKNWGQFNEQKCLIQRLKNENKELKRINKELCGSWGKVKKVLDSNGYNKIVCPLCNGDLRESRQVAYPNGEVYYEFDCNECSFSGRIRKGNLYE